jgi:hypothetical protein
VILAHQGGWDEAFMVFAPFVIFLVLTRRRHRQEAERGAPPTG